MKQIKIDVNAYERLLDERREAFWVEIPDELWKFAIPEHIDDLIACYGDADPMVIVDNLAVNTEWCSRESYKDDYSQMGYKTFAEFCEARAIAYNDDIAVLHW